MFNVTVIKLRDILKYIAIVIAIYFLGKIIIQNTFSKINIKNEIGFNTDKFLKLGINSESTVIKYVSKDEKNANEEKTEEVEEEDFEKKSLEKILQIGTNAFKYVELKEELGQETKVALVENKEILNQERAEIAQTNTQVKDLATQVVTQNPIKESYNKEYNGIKIKNETEFELTDSILNSDSLNINQNNIIIFHTHTCESYTQSDQYQYEETRKF